MSIPQQCTAAVFVEANQPLVLRSFDVPPPVVREAIVRIECATLCGSDVHTVLGHRREPQPSILGHEAIGRVVAVGDPPLCDVNDLPLQVGDRVTWSPVVACGQCVRCRMGLPQKCLQLKKYGHLQLNDGHALSGGLAEYLVLRPGSAVVKLAADWDANIFCPVSCATATVAAGLRKVAPLQDQKVLVLGAGMLGLTTVAWCHAQGASVVALADVNEQRLDAARQFGATHGILATGNWIDNVATTVGVSDFDVVLEMSGAISAVNAAIRLAGIGGRVALIGSTSPMGQAEFDPELVVRRCLSIFGNHNFTPLDLLSAAKFLSEFGTAYPFASLVAQSFPLRDINEAFAYVFQHRPVRVMIQP